MLGRNASVAATHNPAGIHFAGPVGSAPPPAFTQTRYAAPNSGHVRNAYRDHSPIVHHSPNPARPTPTASAIPPSPAAMATRPTVAGRSAGSLARRTNSAIVAAPSRSSPSATAHQTPDTPIPSAIASTSPATVPTLTGSVLGGGWSGGRW